KGEARVWDLGTEGRPVEDLLLVGQVLAGHRIGATGSTEPLEPSAYTDAMQALRTKYPGDFATLPEQLLAWHRRHAQQCQARAGRGVRPRGGGRGKGGRRPRSPPARPPAGTPEAKDPQTRHTRVQARIYADQGKAHAGTWNSQAGTYEWAEAEALYSRALELY